MVIYRQNKAEEDKINGVWRGEGFLESAGTLSSSLSQELTGKCFFKLV